MACSEDMVHARMAAVSVPASQYVVHSGFIEEVMATDQTIPAGLVCLRWILIFYEADQDCTGLICIESRFWCNYRWSTTTDSSRPGAKVAVDEIPASNNGLL